MYYCRDHFWGPLSESRQFRGSIRRPVLKKHEFQCNPGIDGKINSHTILFYLVLLLYFLVFLGISLYSFVFVGIWLYSLESLCTFAYHPVLLSAPFPCIPEAPRCIPSYSLESQCIPRISLYIRTPFCST